MKKNVMTLLFVCVLSSGAFADTYYVNQGESIQAAIDAASNGDEILVMPGTYTGTGAQVIDLSGKAVWLHSSGGQEKTIIDCEGDRVGIICTSNETSKTIIEGLTIYSGLAVYGGGMYSYFSSPLVKNCKFYDNKAEYGGGVFNMYSNATYLNCEFSSNYAFYNGGGLATSGGNGSTLIDCTFVSNVAEWFGDAMYNVNSSPTIMNCTFDNNESTYVGSYILNNPSVPNPTQGACCVITGCSETSTDDCVSLGGTWLGEGGSCDGCSSACAADLDGDGEVKVADLLILIAAWGACP
ncbi:MAG: right-handed parallel beta-helix repeat-containing protein [Anaerolineales bacterium]|nr:right-handed parallel beta-helix repeat-containing protein [Anaerolineales bacterium]